MMSNREMGDDGSGHSEESVRPLADGVRLPAHFPPDTLMLETYDEVMEVIRSAKFALEPPGERALLTGGALVRLHGDEHLRRRRSLNALVSRQSLRAYQTRVRPMLRKRLFELARSQPGPIQTADLLSLGRSVFVHVAGYLIGLERLETIEGGDELLTLTDALVRLHTTRWFSEGDRQSVITAGLAAKQAYVDGFYKPAMSNHTKRSDNTTPSTADERFAPPNLLSLVAARVDPSWSDEELAIRESLAFLIGVVNSSTMGLVHTVDEVLTWIARDSRGVVSLDLSLLNRIAAESLRLHPSKPAAGRIALEDVTTSTGRIIAKGTTVALMNLAANTDRSVYGSDAGDVNPFRTVPPGVPRYGVTFGGGVHQCLGLGIVLGMDDVGLLAVITKALIDAGIARDPTASATYIESERAGYASYPVRFDNLRPWLSTTV